MTEPSPHEVTQLLQAWGGGNQQALERLIPLVHGELHRLAKGYMARERPGHTLQTTALVNEAYLRLVDVKAMNWQNRAHFIAVCAQLMRRILVDSARARTSRKRGGDFQPVSLDKAQIISQKSEADLVALDQALNRLAATDPRKGRVVELHFFGGMTLPETAEVLKVSTETAMRDWKLAKVWLLRELGGKQQNGL